MDLKTLLVDLEPPLFIAMIHRPQVMNALNRRFWDDLNSLLDEVEKNDECHVLIVTGSGKAFSAGADLKESKARSESEYREYIENLQNVSQRLYEFPKPTIAAINGYAIGSGYELTLACDLRVASYSASFSSPEVRVSSAATGGASKFLQDLVGPGKARELMFTGCTVDAREAERIGLVNACVPDDELLDTARSLGRTIAEGAIHSLQVIKEGLLLASSGASLDTILENETESCLSAVKRKERDAAIVSFEARKK